MKYEYQIKKINWNNQSDRDKWEIEALFYGLENSIVVTEIIDGVETAELFLGDNFFDKEHKEDSVEYRIVKWFFINDPERFI